MADAQFISYAQNSEDVVLWRALRHVPSGTYVDVGAADPSIDSVTCAFYERGWRGVNIEPVESFAAALAEARPDDKNIAVAIGREQGRAKLFVSEQTGLSTLLPDVAGNTSAQGRAVVERDVEIRRLDDVLEDEGLKGRPIHFCKIDVEGAEADVLAGFDLSRWLPWVLVVEATVPQTTIPSHESWEPEVLAAGYTFCLFDGLNRFYASPEHVDLVATLSYPAGVFDQPFAPAAVAAELHRLDQVALDSYAEIGRLAEAAEALHQDQLGLQRRVTAADTDAAAVRRQLATTEQLVAAMTRDALSWRSQTLVQLEEVAALRRDAHALYAESLARRGAADDLQRRLEAVERTVSWRVTRPIRAVRRAQLTARAARQAGRESASTPAESAGFLEYEPELERGAGAAFSARLLQAVSLVEERDDLGPRFGVDLSGALKAFEQAVETSNVPTSAKAWLGLVATNATYPADLDLQRFTRALRTDGAAGLVTAMLEQFQARLRDGTTSERVLEVVRDGVIIDVSHTVAHDLHTGIQRVVRETVGRWVSSHDVTLVNFELSNAFATALAPGESRRLVEWRRYVHTSGADEIRRVPEVASGAVVVPWRCQWLLPELVADPAQCDVYRALAQSRVLRGLSLIGFDLIPVTATETVAEFMSTNFAAYLSIVKHARRLSAISEATAHDFQAFGAMLASQGLSGPDVVAHTLPTEAPVSEPADLTEVHRALGRGDLPIVLAVGSHEPRKNHRVLLEAVQRLWRRGLTFQLLMIGGSGWRSGDFDEYVTALQSAGHPVTVWKRATERRLWAAYRVARFSVFPSLLEGYGLPVAESLACGTPAVTSNFGSMAEIAAPGSGAVTVDPRDVEALEDVIGRLLTDEAWLEQLRAEAATRPGATWDEYAVAVWKHLTD
jgi:FkbM family methyltransferase